MTIKKLHPAKRGPKRKGKARIPTHMKPGGAESLFFSANKEDREILASAAQAGEGRTARIRRGLRTVELIEALADHQAKLMAAIASSTTKNSPTVPRIDRELYVLDDVILILTLCRMKDLWLRKANVPGLQDKTSFRALLATTTAAIRSDPNELRNALNFMELAENLFTRLADKFATGNNQHFVMIWQAYFDYRDIVSLYAMFDRILERPNQMLTLQVQHAMPDHILWPPKK